MNRVAYLLRWRTASIFIVAFGPSSLGVSLAADRTNYELSAPPGTTFVASLSSDDEPGMTIDIFMSYTAKAPYRARLSMFEEGRMKTSKWTDSSLCPDLNGAMTALATLPAPQFRFPQQDQSGPLTPPAPISTVNFSRRLAFVSIRNDGTSTFVEMTSNQGAEAVWVTDTQSRLRNCWE